MINVYFFRNGNTAVCDGEHQLPQLQRPWIRLFVDFLQSQGVDVFNAEFHLPDGYSRAKLIKTSDGYSWQVQP